ncbi:MAG: polymerase, sigma-24 subunit, subfamily [Myxococcales bacterium]|nr:polymerase, sigma-24 subunit, subfamily [Myxococcales bacterium]
MGSPLRDGSVGLRLVPRDPASPSPAARPALDDRALIASVQAGDAACASTLCARVWLPVDRTIRRLLGNGDADRDDVAQLALIELVNSIDRYRGDCSLDSWAQTITAHVIFKHIRRRRLERRIFTDLLAEDASNVCAPAHTEQDSAKRQLLARVAAHLDDMKTARAWAFVMHDVLGYDLREMAQMTASSVAATQSRLVRGRRDLHDRVAKDPELVELMAEMERGP